MVIAIVNKGSGQRAGYYSAEPTANLLNKIRMISEPEDFRNFYFFFKISVMIII